MSVENLKRYRRATWVGGLLMLVLYLMMVCLLGTSDYDQALANHEWNCQMIREGFWPKGPGIDCPDPAHDLVANTAMP